MPKKKKLKVGFFSFTCDEGCMISILEIFNDYFAEWKDLMEFRHFRLLQPKNTIEDIDVAFIEGAISNLKEEKTLKKIRENAKKIVAIGSCAITSAPSNHRNFFDEAKLEEIKPIMKKFGHREKVVPLKEIIKVDDEVPGCPLMPEIFVEKVDKYLKEFGVANA